jgi:hypothetical protein
MVNTRKRTCSGGAWAVLFTWCLPSTLPAVIVAGANGGGNTAANTDAASLNAYLGSEGSPAFSFWDNVALYGNGNAVYLGAAEGWVLTANHVSNSATVDFQGITYDVVEASRQQVGAADLELFRITHATQPLPSLIDVSLDSATPSIGTEMILMGAGRNRQEDAATDPSTPDTTLFPMSLEGYTRAGSRIGPRWGTNLTEDASPALGMQETTVFNGNPALTAPRRNQSPKNGSAGLGSAPKTCS